MRIRGVHDRVARMNAILRRCPTASGKVIQLDWRVQDEDGLRPTIELLRRAVSVAGPQERDRLVEFFRGRIEAARRGSTAAGGEAMVDTLATAFDYRGWHAFDLVQEHGGTRARLTRKRHAVGSGGEQAVLIHLPLFAAAAALYDDTPAPRLVMLDEALSGIDDETRQRVLGATVDFGLDLVMTSHELWGTYVTVPALSIYQLHRHNGEPGVHAIGSAGRLAAALTPPGAPPARVRGAPRPGASTQPRTPRRSAERTCRCVRSARAAAPSAARSPRRSSRRDGMYPRSSCSTSCSPTSSAESRPRREDEEGAATSRRSREDLAS